jgi:pantoate--beta-alanine ligase
MQAVKTVEELRRVLSDARGPGRKVGFVPTMGYLHAGHMALVAASCAQCQVTVVSIFVNPTQFGPKEDLSSYPRDVERDLSMLDRAGVDVVFVPDVPEVYPEDFQTEVDPGPLSQPLCGMFRPGHFRGVATVVAKLFNMVQPDMAFFGRKDFQQLTVITRMARDLDMPVEVVGIDTVREADGMAMSSRNAYLDADQRTRGATISKGLFAARAAFAAGERNPAMLLAQARSEMTGFDSLQYLELVDAATLQPFGGVVDRPAVMAVAGFIGKTRLIDNVLLTA